MISSNFNLVVLNLWIGLCRGATGLPRFFRQREYRTHYIERAFSNQDSDRVCPEIVVFSRLLGHTIMVESKSGANTEPDQLRRYSRVSGLDLQRQGNVPADACALHDCVVMGLALHGERLQMGIEAGEYPFPLLVADDEGLSLVHNQFSVDEVTAAFSPIMRLDWGAVPMHFVPINSESEDADVAEAVMPLIIELMHAREDRIAPDQVCVRMCTTWPSMGPDGKTQTIAKVSRIFEEAATGEFAEFFQYRRGVLHVVNNPLDLDTPRTSLAFRRLLKAQQRMLERLSGGQLEIKF